MRGKKERWKRKLEKSRWVNVSEKEKVPGVITCSPRICSIRKTSVGQSIKHPWLGGKKIKNKK